MGEALAAATRALARRDYSERGLRDRLRRAGVDETELDEVLTELRSVGLLDDERFAGRRASQRCCCIPPTRLGVPSRRG